MRIVDRFGQLSLSALSISLIAGLGACSSTRTDSNTPAGDAAQGAIPGEPAKVQAQDAPSDSGTPTASAALKGTSFAGSAERISATPIQSGQFWLNAFYFVRAPGENWQTVSQTIYGRPDRAELLQNWNPDAKLKVGSVVYYNSPFRPTDSQTMKPFAADFGAELEVVVVKKGDTLSKIAKARYGEFQAWREIASMNPDLQNPNQIEVGQRIMLAPASLDTASILSSHVAAVQQTEKAAKKTETPPTSVGSVEAPPAPPAEVAMPTQSDQAAQAPVMAKPIEDQNTKPIAANAPPKKKAAKAGQLDQAMMMQIGAAIAVVALIALFVVRRRRKTSKFETNEVTMTGAIPMPRAK